MNTDDKQAMTDGIRRIDIDIGWGVVMCVIIICVTIYSIWGPVQ